MNKKIFFFDMDGTIVDRDSKMRPASEEALKEARAKGHITAIATGRPYSDIIKDVKPELFDYLIANNGSYYYDVNKKEFHYNGTVDKKIALDFLKIAIETKSMFAAHCEGTAYRGHFQTGPATDNVNIDPNGDNFKYYSEEEIRNKILDNDVVQISLRNTVEVIEGINSKYSKILKGVELHIANEIYFDINPEGVSKLLGVKSVLKHEDMSLEQAVAFGDSGNDLQMVKGVGVGVAVGNATQNLKDIADVVIGDNNSDAIADKIRELI